MKSNKDFWGLLSISILQAVIFGYEAFLLHKTGLPDFVIIAALIGFSQIKSSTDTIKIQNDIFDLKKHFEEKNKVPDCSEKTSERP